jgi:methyl-accepting chemotaxis protein
MRWLSELKMSTKLIVSFSSILALTVLIGIFSVIQLHRVNQTSTDMEINWMPSVRVTSDMNTNTSDFRVAELQHILSVDPNEMARYEQQMANVMAQFEKNRAEYVALISSQHERQMYETFMKNWNEYLEENKKVIALSRTNANEEAKGLIRGNSQVQFNKASDDLNKLADLNIQGGKEASQLGNVLHEGARGWIIGLIVTAVLLSTLIVVAVIRKVRSQLGGDPAYAAEIVRSIAKGDLNVHVEVAHDDKQSLLFFMNEMRGSLEGIVNQVRAGTVSIGVATGQIEEQASSLEETASSMEEMTSTVKQNADNARQANQLAISASDIATRGGAVVAQVVDTMGAINASSSKIVDIIGVIDGIAFQTNILALNAAVEAARAGEQGRGFAVVASEVRNLAQRAAAAAKEIKVLIGASVEQVEVGASLVNQAGSTMQGIVDSIRSVTDIMGEISAANQEQTSGIEQINQAITQMDHTTQQNAALVEEAAAASQALQDQAVKLSELVSVFKTNQTLEIAAAAPAASRQASTVKVGAATSRPGLGSARRASAVAKPLKLASAQPAGGGSDWEEF